MPETHLIERSNLVRLANTLSYPRVLKTPDGCFSAGVKRAADPASFIAICERMLASSDVVLAQEFVPTAFDWRIGVLAGRPLFAVRYHMATGHWQIIRHDADGTHKEGRTEAVPIEAVPDEIVDAAVRAASLVGDGLYGVDLKETVQGTLVIEVNDNPNIDVGLEDAVLGDELYRILLRHFITLSDRHGRTRAHPRPTPRPAILVTRREPREIAVPPVRRRVEHLSL